ncbi:MAG: hypothetical protein K2Q28_17560 [Hyphomicrobium sp.]|nr:hypothetical protein [Hyphomicrobium sp.]
MFEDAPQVSLRIDAQKAQAAPDNEIRQIERRPASSWNFLAWSFFLAQVLTSHAAQAALETISQAIDPELGKNTPHKSGTDAPAAAKSSSAASSQANDDTPPAGAEAANAPLQSVGTAEIGGMEVGTAAEAGMVRDVGEGAVSGASGQARDATATAGGDGGIHVIGVIIEVPAGGSTSQPGVIIDAGGGTGINVDLDLTGDMGLSVDATLGGIVDAVLDVDLNDNITTTIGVSLGDMLDAGVDLDLSNDPGIDVDAGLGGLANVAFDLNLGEGVSTDLGVTIGDFATAGFVVDLSNGINIGLDAGLGQLADLALDLTTANNLELDAAIDAGGLVGIAFGTDDIYASGADVSVAEFAGIDLVFALNDGAAVDLGALVGDMAALNVSVDTGDQIAISADFGVVQAGLMIQSGGSLDLLNGVLAEATPVLASTTDLGGDVTGLLTTDIIATMIGDEAIGISEVLAANGIVQDLSLVLLNLDPSASSLGDLSPSLLELGNETTVGDLLIESVPSLLTYADEITPTEFADFSILGLELSLDNIGTVAESSSSSFDMDPVAVADFDRAPEMEEDFSTLADILPMPVLSTISIIETPQEAVPLPFEIATGGAYTDYGINLQLDDVTGGELPSFVGNESDEGGLFSSVDSLLSLDDTDVLDEANVWPGALPDDGGLKGLGSILM